jgi:hypothetical protein
LEKPTSEGLLRLSGFVSIADQLDDELLQEALYGVFCELQSFTTLAARQPLPKGIPAERYEEHDTFFRIRRVAGNAMSVFARSIVQIFLETAGEATHASLEIPSTEWPVLRTAFIAMLAFLAPAALNEHQPPITAPRTALSNGPHHHDVAPEQGLDPLRRWRLGHHIFLVLIQCLEVAMNCFADDLEKAEDERAHASFGLAVTLMRASAQSLKFASAFRAKDYEDYVRPAMMPPYLTHGFSGVQSLDHQFLIRTLKGLRSVFGDMPEGLRAQHEQFTQALAETYDSHKLVCARFGGMNGPSLRMNATTKMTATDGIDQLKRSRLGILRPS